MLPVELSEPDGVDGVGVGAEEDGHLAVGGARVMLQVVFPGFLCKMEIVFCFCVPEFLQDLVDRPISGNPIGTEITSSKYHATPASFKQKADSYYRFNH